MLYNSIVAERSNIRDRVQNIVTKHCTELDSVQYQSDTSTIALDEAILRLSNQEIDVDSEIYVGMSTEVSLGHYCFS